MMIGKQRRATGGEPVGGLRVHGLGFERARDFCVRVCAAGWTNMISTHIF